MMSATPAGMQFNWTIDESMSVLDAALTYVQNGAQPVFLHGVASVDEKKCTCSHKEKCRSQGKHPVLLNWASSIAKEEIAVRDQFARIKIAPANIGLVLGGQPSGDYLIAIDVDNEDRLDHLTGEFGALPKTPRCDSGRGYRLFYKLPTGIPTDRLKNVTGIGGESGVDAKVKGGQVVVAPSLHVNGKRYAWVEDSMGALADLPMTWVDGLITEPLPPPFARDYTPETIRADDKAKRKLERYLEKAVIEECSRLARLPEGQRNTYLHRKAISLLSLVNGCFIPARWAYVLSELDRAARAAGLDAREVRKTLTSAENFVSKSGATRGPRPIVADPTPISSPPSAPMPSSGAPPSSPPPTDPPDPGASSPGAPPPPPPPPASLLIVLVQDRGQNAAIAENVARLLSHHDDWCGGPRLDQLGFKVRWPTPLPPMLEGMDRRMQVLADSDAAVIQGWLLSEFRIRAGIDTVREGIALASSRKRYDSLVECVEKLPPHDGTPRIEAWLSTYFGAPDTSVTRRIGRAWLTSTLARALFPGCVADIMLILEGLEGTGKNWGIEQLFGGEWVGQLGTYKIGEHSEADRMAGMFWILHDDELRSVRKTQKDAIFSWLTRKTDTFRLQHSREIMTIARRSVVVGSKNPPYEYLDDGENRRFAPVRTGRIDIPAIERDREQLLAEALIIARQKDAKAWTIGKEDPIWEGLSDDRADRVIDDPLIQDVMLKLPDDVDAVTTRWLLNELGVPPERRKQSDQAVAAALRTLGFEGQKSPRTVPGRPRVFVRTGVVWSDKTKVLV